MRTAHIFALLCTAALFQVAAAAPATDTGVANKPAQHSHMNPADIAEVQGTYTLSDGRTLRVLVEKNKLYASVDGRKEELTFIADNVFLTHDGHMKLTFEPRAFETTLVLEAPLGGSDIDTVASR